MALTEYRRKRRFTRTPEPPGTKRRSRAKAELAFVVQKHDATHLHYDFRLELDGVLKSWAVPKGPSLDPTVKALAVHVEDHPLEYGSFEGIIPPGEYGGGTVMLWDRGIWKPEGNAREGYRRGKLTFELQGEKLRGRWALVRMSGLASNSDQKHWLLKKIDDRQARTLAAGDILQKKSKSVSSGRTMHQIAQAADNVWTGKESSSGRAEKKPRSPKRLAAATSQGSRTRSLREKAAASRHSLQPSSLSQASRRPLPARLKPQLATLVQHAPEGDEWLHELKLDGYRLLCVIRNGKAKLLTRQGNDWTSRFPTVQQAAEALGLKQGILDGEVVILERDGTTNFQSLQNLMQRGRDDDIVYFVFDLPYCEGYDLTASPLDQRKALLASILSPHESPRGRHDSMSPPLPQPSRKDKAVIRYCDHIVGHGPRVAEQACRHGLEGVVSKRADSRYVQRRATSWLKVKCLQRQEFVIGGWTDPAGSRQGFGALLLGYHDDAGELVYCGRVGTGFNQRTLRQIKARLVELEVDDSPFENPPRRSRGVHWVEPKLVAEVEFGQWTEENLLRHPAFLGLREDKSPLDVTREKPVEPSTASRRRTATKSRKLPTNRVGDGHRSRGQSGSNQVAGVRLSNASRVLYPEQNLTKRDLAEYYIAVAEWIMPHLVERPLTIVRCPRGRQSKCFYQKHVTKSIPPSVRRIEIPEKDGTAHYVGVDDLPGLITLVQLGVLELHPWGSRADLPDNPDRLVLDLDPGEDTTWKEVVAAAHRLRARLRDLGLESFARTTGGKGLHVVAPLARRAKWPAVKSFAKALADSMAREDPERYVATASKAKRRGKIYVDYLRNDWGATAIASYSTRARPGAPVATPITWDELSADLQPNLFSVSTIPSRLERLRHDPWQGFDDVQQTISVTTLKQLGNS